MAWMVPTIEFTELLTADGETYQFHVPSRRGRWVASESGWGTPPIEYITQRGPFQHGETVKDYFLRPRVIQLLLHQAYCSRDDWWTGRGNLLNYIRPNRGDPNATPATLRRILSDNSVRALDVFIASGPQFEPRLRGEWSEWSFHEVLRFVAYDPVIYDPTRVDVVYDFGTLEELSFPISFIVGSDIWFGHDQMDETVVIAYTGTWLSYPIIVITGPMSNIQIDNLTTGETIEFDYTIPDGVVVTFDLRYGIKTVVDDSGMNLIGSISSDSDLATFHIAPDPEAAGGNNSIRVQGSGAVSGRTSVEVRYYTRYFGI